MQSTLILRSSIPKLTQLNDWPERAALILTSHQTCGTCHGRALLETGPTHSSFQMDFIQVVW